MQEQPTDSTHLVSLRPGRYRMALIGGGSSDGSPGGYAERVLDLREDTLIEIVVGEAGSPDAPPGSTSIIDLRTGKTLVCAPPIPPYWEPLRGCGS